MEYGNRVMRERAMWHQDRVSRITVYSPKCNVKQRLPFLGDDDPEDQVGQ